ncbi:unnamed protein product [Didymodactylos carnosus]|uniref:Uncharacterized protein n=1 Tax=Didymodactylos carnosus TaxID=1234261 RepID=A0A815XU06_9BILA|nr:unnamed protein product [Didymodactylos carnosus]CAF4423301.1 unnamed protein product [Didymodactylos carnosus]
MLGSCIDGIVHNLRFQKKDIMSLLSFRISVAEDLLKSNPQPLSSQKRDRPSLHSIDKENLAAIPPRTAPGPAPSTNSRFDKYDHWPIHTGKGRC